MSDDELPLTRPQLHRLNASSPNPCTYGNGLERKRYFKNIDGQEIPIYSDNGDPFCRLIIDTKRDNSFVGRINNINIVERDYPEYLFKKYNTKKSRGAKKSRGKKKSKGKKSNKKGIKKPN
jgi:hypothetical protein